MAKFADKFFTTLLLLAPLSTAWATQNEPPNKDSLSLRNRHEVDVEFSIGSPHEAFSSETPIPNWNLGCIYGYPRAQKSTSTALLSLFWLEAGLKYGSRAKRYKSGCFTVKEPSLYIPTSVGLFAIVPAWKSSLCRKVALGVGFETVIALSSQLLTEGGNPRDLLKTIPGLSRFSGSIFVSLKTVLPWGIYFGFSMKFLKFPKRSRDTQFLYSKDCTLSKQDIDSFRADTTSFLDLNLGLDIMQLLEDLGVYNPFWGRYCIAFATMCHKSVIMLLFS